jgi:hypothetical protein
MTIVCNPTTTVPEAHIKLSDGVTEYGFILKPNAKAIQRRPRQNGQYAPFTQSDWSSGRGIKDAGSDRSRFADSKRLITRHSGTVMLGGQETYTTGYRSAEAYMPGNITWQSLLTTNRYIAYSVTCSATGNRGAVYLWVRRRGTPTSTLTVELCANNTDKPGTVLKTVTATTANITDTISQLYEFAFSSVQAVTSTTVYWVKVYTSAADTTTNYWQVGTDAADTNNLTKASSDGSTWSACAYDLYFRMVDDTDQLGGIPFTYLSQQYFVTRPSGSAAPLLYINGDRGIATGSQTTTTLQDTTKAWTADEFIGCVVMITGGTNSEWQTPYRTITDNDTNTLTFSDFPKACVSGSSTYVILGSNKWTLITGHGLTVLPTSVASEGETCYFAQGDSVTMRRMREYINSAVYARAFAEENNYAKFLLTYRSATYGLMLGKANDTTPNGPAFFQAAIEPWGRRLKFPYLITDCETTTGWTAGTNVAVTSSDTVFITGTASILLTVSGAAGTTYFPVTMDASRANAIRFWAKSSVARDAGEWSVFLSTSATAASAITGATFTLPTLPAAEWKQVVIPYSPTLDKLPGVKSIAFTTTTTAGTLYIDGLELFPKGSETLLGKKEEKITGLECYGDPEVPWVFRTQSVGSIQNGVFSPIPLREMSQVESVHNGVGHCVHNVNLYFSFLHGFERFYRNNLDDVGPNRDEGLPDERRGFISSMSGYIGRLLYNVDTSSGNSSIMESAGGTDHHEIYRCDTAGKRIRNIYTQVIPGDTADKLWFTEGDDIAWLSMPGNTLKEDTDNTFRFTHEGVLETGWIFSGDGTEVTLYTSVRLTTENLSATKCIEWDYKTDTSTTWTSVSTSFTSSSVQEIALNVSAKRLKLRFRLQTNDNTITPIIKRMFVSATMRPETRYTYTLNTQIMDNPIDLQGKQSSTTAATVLTQLDTWMEANTVLTMSSVFSPFHNKSVFLEPVITQPVSLTYDESAERLSLTLILVEP